MSWLVSRHGRHTPAALVHDQLVQDGISFEERQRADRCFVDMMDAMQVPFVLSRIMGAAVSMATRWRGPLLAKVGIVLWGLLAAVGIAALIVGLITLTPWLVGLSLLLPALGGAALGSPVHVRCRRRGTRSRSSPLPARRRAARLLDLLGDRDDGPPASAPLFHHNTDRELPTPIGYQGR